MEIFNSNNSNSNVKLQPKKSFSPSKLIPDFSRRYAKSEPPVNAKSNSDFINIFKLSNKNLTCECESNSDLNFSIPKKHSANWHSSNLSNSSGDTDTVIDSNRILAIILKEKYENYSNVSEFELEDNISRNVISSKYLSTPFDDDLNIKRETPGLNSASLSSFATNRDAYLERKMKSDIMSNKQQFKKYKVNDYFFQNLEDFENKFYKKNERLRLSETPIQSKFQGVETYGFSNECKPISPLVTESIQKNKDILSKVNKTKCYMDVFFKPKPIEKQKVIADERDLATPPLLSFHNNRPVSNIRTIARLRIKKPH